MPSMKIFALVTVLSTAIGLLLPISVAAVEEPVTKTLVWPDGTRYVGGVLDGKRSGKGTIFWQDGTRFVGQFENDMRNGPGTMILPDGNVYTGFFQDDELIDTESTIAATGSAELDEAETTSALGNTELPMEADSISSEDMADTVTSSNVENVDPGPGMEPDAKESTDDDLFDAEVNAVTTAVEDDLRETIDLWGAAWSEQNVTQYLANYSTDFRTPNGQSRRQWETLRRSRLTRPRYINIDIDYQRFEFVETNVVDAFFRQSYRSNTYSDLTDKVLRMRKEGSDWKILVERSR